MPLSHPFSGPSRGRGVGTHIYAHTAFAKLLVILFVRTDAAGCTRKRKRMELRKI